MKPQGGTHGVLLDNVPVNVDGRGEFWEVASVMAMDVQSKAVIQHTFAVDSIDLRLELAQMLGEMSFGLLDLLVGRVAAANATLGNLGGCPGRCRAEKKDKGMKHCVIGEGVEVKCEEIGS